MKNHSLIAILLLAGWLLSGSLAHAAGGRSDIVWRGTASRRTGLYTTQNYFVSEGISASVSGLYYYGDIDNVGFIFNGGINNRSLGMSVSAAYNMPIGNMCNLRFGLLGGSLQGNNKDKFKSLDKPRSDYKRFYSYLLEPSVGVQFYPFTRAGLYLYGGLALAFSYIYHYRFYYYDEASSIKEVHGSTYGILPIVQLGVGYTWRLTEGWSLGVEFMIQEGLIDSYYANLDGLPMDKSQNVDGVQIGSGAGVWERSSKKEMRWNDGWYQLGLTVTYHWRTCEHCRFINNYQGVRGGKRRY